MMDRKSKVEGRKDGWRGDVDGWMASLKGEGRAEVGQQGGSGEEEEANE